MSCSFDFHRLEALEVVAHLRSVLGALPVRPLRRTPVEESMSDTSDCGDHAEASDGDHGIELLRRVSSLKGRKAHGHNGKTSNGRKPCSAKIAQIPQKLSRNPNALRRWSSFASGILRKEFGDGLLNHRRTHALRASKRDDRKRYLAEFGLEEPEVMPRYARWLRSSFVEDIPRSRQAFPWRHGCKWPCKDNDDNSNKVVVHSKIEDPLETPSGWALLISRLLNSYENDPFVSRKQLRARRLEPSAAILKRWARLHDVDVGKILAAKQRDILFHQAPPHQLTLSFQHKQWRAIEKKRGSKHILRCWSRMLMGLHASYRRQCRRAALRDVIAMRAQVEVRECCRDEWFAKGWKCNICGRGCSEPDFQRFEDEGSRGAASLASPSADEETLAAQLGLDVATYRMLRQLEQRDIVPEDYDLLGRLDEAVKPKTLTVEDLGRYMIKTFMASSRNVPNTTLLGFDHFGANYWQLPLPPLEDDFQELPLKSSCFGVDFWKIQDLKVEETGCTSTVASENDQDDSANDGSAEICGVCLVDFDEGDEMRVLPCAHYFHRDCIDHWLLHSATMCPTCKCELLQED